MADAVAFFGGALMVRPTVAASGASPLRSIDLPAVMKRLIPKAELHIRKFPPPKDATIWGSAYADDLRSMAMEEARKLSVADACLLYEAAGDASYAARGYADDITSGESAAWLGIEKWAIQTIIGGSSRTAEDVLARMNWIAREAMSDGPHVAMPEAVETLQRELARFLLTGVR